MKTIFSIFGLLVVFVLFLSIEVGGKPLFSHIYGFISPATRSAQNTAEKFFSKSVNNTQNYSKRLFDNSVPDFKDTVKSKLSSQRSAGAPAEKITHKEKKELDDLIKNH